MKCVDQKKPPEPGKGSKGSKGLCLPPRVGIAQSKVDTYNKIKLQVILNLLILSGIFFCFFLWSKRSLDQPALVISEAYFGEEDSKKWTLVWQNGVSVLFSWSQHESSYIWFGIGCSILKLRTFVGSRVALAIPVSWIFHNILEQLKG